MSQAKLEWRERTSASEFVTSVWTCSTAEATRRTVLADPCISIALVKGDGQAEVILSGPSTRPRSEYLPSGYVCTAIRLRPGVVLRGFLAQGVINSSLAVPADAASRFWLAGSELQFPDFQYTELLIDQLQTLGYLSYESSIAQPPRATKTLSARTYFRLVKRTTGLSPYQLQQLQRIHEALKLLKQGVPAATVAAELDFVDQSHLAHASRQFLGHTPKELLDLPQTP